MPLEQELIDLMLEEVTLELRSGVPDKFNEFSYALPITVRCKIIRMNKQVVDSGGRETTSTVQVILADPTIAVTVDTRLTLPVDAAHPSTGERPDIIEVRSVFDDEGPYYLEIRA